ncbi:hypothetical protein H632_c592p0, partial [Helicosporidium sp. ATCC 50920]
TFHEQGGLVGLDWVQTFLKEPGMELVHTCGAMADAVAPDHMDLIKDVVSVWNPQTREFHSLLALGSEVAGHPRITHGGLTAAILDETTGMLVYEGKRAGWLGPGQAFTARLEVDYRRPLPVDVEVVCTASLLETQGRKIWVRTEMRDRPGGEIYAEGKALFVSVKQPEQAT